MGAGPCQRLLTTLTRLPWLRQPGSQGADPEAPASSLGRLLPASAANLAPCWTARWPLTSTGPESEGQRVAVTSGRLAWPQHRWLAGVPGLGWSAWWPMAAPVLYQTPPRSLPRSPLSPWSSPEACFSFSQLFFLFLLPPLSSLCSLLLSSTPFSLHGVYFSYFFTLFFKHALTTSSLLVPL